MVPQTHEQFRAVIGWDGVTCYICGASTEGEHRRSATLCATHYEEWEKVSVDSRSYAPGGWTPDLFIQKWVVVHPELGTYRPDVYFGLRCGSCQGPALIDDYLCEECRSNLHPT
jgi:hypothetical protein